MEKGELVDRVIKLTQELAAEQDKNKILAEQKAVLVEALQKIRLLESKTNSEWVDEVSVIVDEAINKTTNEK